MTGLRFLLAVAAAVAVVTIVILIVRPTEKRFLSEKGKRDAG